MQTNATAATTAATAERPPARHVVRLAGELAALLGRAEGAEGSEDELLLWLIRAPQGLSVITYPALSPSPPASQHRGPAHAATSAIMRIPAAAVAVVLTPYGAVYRFVRRHLVRRLIFALLGHAVDTPAPAPAVDTPATAPAPSVQATASPAVQPPSGEDAERPPDLLEVRLGGALAALLGRAEGAEGSEDELLGWLREEGLITYPSPLLGRLLAELTDVCVAEVLPRLDPAARAVLAQVARPWLAAVMGSGLSRAGSTAGVPLKLREFVGSVQRLAWAKADGCPWNARTCERAAGFWPRDAGGNLEVLRYAREHGCPWNEAVMCQHAATHGNLEVLRYAREQGCPWNEGVMCRHAAGGNVEVVMYAREQGCPWDEETTGIVAECGDLKMLKCLWEHGCPWEGNRPHAPLVEGTGHHPTGPWRC